jgi:hypothetical protein
VLQLHFIMFSDCVMYVFVMLFLLFQLLVGTLVFDLTYSISIGVWTCFSPCTWIYLNTLNMNKWMNEWHILSDCEVLAEWRFNSPGTRFMKPSDFCKTPLIKVLHFIHREIRFIRWTQKADFIILPDDESTATLWNVLLLFKMMFRNVQNMCQFKKTCLSQFIIVMRPNQAVPVPVPCLDNFSRFLTYTIPSLKDNMILV